MAAVHGNVSKFEPEQESWTNYTLRLEQYFTANDVNDEGKRKVILLAACGAATFKNIQSIIGADKVKETSYKDIVAKMKQHYDRPPSPIVQRFRFRPSKLNYARTNFADLQNL